MEYSNPQIPEGINVSDTNPLKELLVLTTGLVVLVLAVVLLFGLMADRLALLIPFEYEQQWVAPWLDTLNQSDDPEIEQELQQLAERVAHAMALPDDLEIKVHYRDEATVNAFATLGGHLVFYRGLLERMPSENSLAMVMAHEIAHVQHRHPLRSLGRGVVISLTLALLSNSSGHGLLEEVLGDTGLLTVLTYSRVQERTADRTALHAVQQLYGHVNGAAELFLVLQEQNHHQLPEFLRTHPLDAQRIEALHAEAMRHSYRTEGRLQPLPDLYRQ